MRSTLVFLLTSAASAAVAFLILMFLFMRYWGLASVEGTPPKTFPVLFAQPGPICSVLLWSELEAAQAQATEWSFVPASDLGECRSQLRPDASVEIEPAEDGRHSVTVTSSPGGDEVNTSRYLATAEAIEPVSHQRYFGPLVAIVAAGISGAFGLVAGALGVRRSRRRRVAT